MKADGEIFGKLVDSLTLMLDFFGIHMSEDGTQFYRAPNYKERYANLIKNKHNHLRISRIIRSLGLLGLEYIQKPLLAFLIDEIFHTGELKDKNIVEACVNHWIMGVSMEGDRMELSERIRSHKARLRPDTHRMVGIGGEEDGVVAEGREGVAAGVMKDEK